jgi:hypothetical protein
MLTVPQVKVKGKVWLLLQVQVKVNRPVGGGASIKFLRRGTAL